MKDLAQRWSDRAEIIEIARILPHLVAEGIMSLMADWYWIEAGNIIPPEPGLRFRLMNPEFIEPTKAFSATLERMYKLWELPASVNEMAYKIMREWMRFALSKGQVESVGNFRDVDAYIQSTLPEFIRRLKKKVEEIGDHKAIEYDRWHSLQTFDKHTRRAGFDEPIRALLESQITSVWTAFETLAEDLWSGATKCNPLLTSKPAQFRSCKRIQETYAGIEPASPVIDAIFIRPEIRKLSLVRNVIVHTSGRIDGMFLQGASDILWNSGDTLGQKIRIDGRLVKEWVNPVIRAGEELIRTVDIWATIYRRNLF